VDYDRCEGPAWEGISASAKGLILSLLVADKEARPNASSVLVHEWLHFGRGGSQTSLNEAVARVCAAPRALSPHLPTAHAPKSQKPEPEPHAEEALCPAHSLSECACSIFTLLTRADAGICVCAAVFRRRIDRRVRSIGVRAQLRKYNARRRLQRAGRGVLAAGRLKTSMAALLARAPSRSPFRGTGTGAWAEESSGRVRPLASPLASPRAAVLADSPPLSPAPS